MKNISLEFADTELKERMEQVQKTRQKWIDEGDQLLKWREKLGLSRSFIARATGVNYGRITRFEQGEPVKEAKLIGHVYKMTLEKVEIRREFERIIESIESKKKSKAVNPLRFSKLHEGTNHLK
jgi:transcriptional regulator with XRE-family HTH domain